MGLRESPGMILHCLKVSIRLYISSSVSSRFTLTWGRKRKSLSVLVEQTLHFKENIWLYCFLACGLTVETTVSTGNTFSNISATTVRCIVNELKCNIFINEFSMNRMMIQNWKSWKGEKPSCLFIRSSIIQPKLNI